MTLATLDPGRDHQRRRAGDLLLLFAGRRSRTRGRRQARVRQWNIGRHGGRHGDTSLARSSERGSSPWARRSRSSWTPSRWCCRAFLSSDSARRRLNPKVVDPGIWEGARLLFADRRLRYPYLDGCVPGRPPGDGDRSPGLAGHDGVGGPRGSVRSLPGLRRCGKPPGEPGGEQAGPAVQERPGPDRVRPRVRRRLPGHGRGAGLAAGGAGLLSGRAGRGRRSRRLQLSPPEADARQGHGPGRRRLAGHRLGRGARRRPAAGSLAALGGLRLPLVLAGCCSAWWRSCWPAPSSGTPGGRPRR